MAIVGDIVPLSAYFIDEATGLPFNPSDAFATVRNAVTGAVVVNGAVMTASVDDPLLYVYLFTPAVPGFYDGVPSTTDPDATEAIDLWTVEVEKFAFSGSLGAYKVNSQVSDFTDALTEPVAVPAANASLRDKINWLFMLARNKRTQTATAQTVKADNGTTTVGTSTVADDGSQLTIEEWT